MIRITVLITTYNATGALANVLGHYLRLVPQPFEYIICDDGSGPETKALIDGFSSRTKVPIRHCYQEDHGWDAPGVRNLGAINSRGDYLIFTDGDCVPQSCFLHDNICAAESGCFVCGDRAHVVTEHVTGFSARPLRLMEYILRKRIQKRTVALRNPFEAPVIYGKMDITSFAQLASVALSCCMGVWKSDYIKVNGFDETWRSWWQDDAEFSARLLNNGLKLKKYHRKCIVYHLDHGPYSKPKVEAVRFAERSLLTNIRATTNGVAQRLARAGCVSGTNDRGNY